MSKHLAFAEVASSTPIYVLKKDMVGSKGQRKTSTLTDVIDCYVTDIADEKVFVNGIEHRIKRVFVKTSDSDKYAGVGWVVKSEISYCMLCSVAFGMFTYQHHCKACGNVVCNNCSLNLVVVMEIEQVGPVRVCNQCYWGQEVVFAAPQKVEEPVKFQQTPPPPKAIEPVVIPEDPEVALKKQQQAEFQRQAIARLAQGQLLKKGTSEFVKGDNSTTSPIRSLSIQPTTQTATTPRQPLQRIPSVNYGNSLTPDNGIASSNPMRAQSMRVTDRNYDAPSPVNSNAITAPPVSTQSATPTSRQANGVSSNATGSSSGARNSSVDFDQQNAQRIQKMMSYGPVSLHSPVPGFVLKTKRSDQTKIFVNVCTHGSVPYRAEEGTNSEGYDLNKVVYMLVGPPLEYQNEKDKSYCVIYDIVVHPDEVYVCSIDSTGIARNRLCNQSLELIAIHYHESLDPSYKILKISSNYKGKNEVAGKVKTQPIVIPSKDAFYALSQMTTNINDVDSSNMDTGATPRGSEKRGSSMQPNLTLSATALSGKGSRSGSVNGSGSPVPESDNSRSKKETPTSAKSRDSVSSTSGAGASTISFISTNQNSRSSITDYDRNTVLENADSVHSNLDHCIKVTCKPIALANKITNNNFNNVLEDLKLYQYSFRDIIISPEAGYVVSAQRSSRGQQIFINICHHPLVAMISVKAANDKGRAFPLDSYPSSTPVPYVIGAIDNDFVCRDASILVGGSGTVGSKGIVIDVVIPSSIMLVIIEDSTGDLRDKLAIDMLENISRLNVKFDSNFILPNVPGGYVGKSKKIFPVINQTEDEKRLYVMSFVGKFNKQGHGVKSWKERLVQIIDSKLKYFDLNSAFKGDFNIDDCNISYVQNAECHAPPDSYPFKLANFVSGGEFMYCNVQNSDLRELFSLVIITKTRQLSTAKDLISIPDLTTGWLKKQGHMVKNWKKRFFVLSYGVIKYYEKNGQESRGSGENELGSVELKGATCKVVINSDLGGKNPAKDYRLSVVQASGKELLVEAESTVEKNAWFDAIKKHIIYANQYN